MATRRRQGEVKQFEHPEWRPLEELVGMAVVADFMWMHEVELSSGLLVHAYKHVDTRRYVHLSTSGTTYVYEPENWYRPMEPADALATAFGSFPELGLVTARQLAASWAAVAKLAPELRVAPFTDDRLERVDYCDHNGHKNGYT